jgi:sodium-dependent phosphate transporter
MTHDIHADVQEDPQVIALAESAERFDPRTEEVFKILQVISACAMMFTHGANGESKVGCLCQPLSLRLAVGC